jgi:chemotaxis protein MotB
MAAQNNAAPTIIKRKKVVKGGGHHGGAWKVAYADFVTAMMAFFMLMWLLNATTEKQRKGLADYFSPTIAIARVSGGGDGAFGGDSVFSEETLPQNGTGATSDRPTDQSQARGARGLDTDGQEISQDKEFASVQAALTGYGGESQVLENALRQIVTRVTDQGLVIEVFETDEAPLFLAKTAQPTQLLRDISGIIVKASQIVTNPIAIEAHVAAEPVVVVRNTVWELSVSRAGEMRVLMEQAGLHAPRIHRVTGHADRAPAIRDPMRSRNNRIEVVLLRPDPTR